VDDGLKQRLIGAFVLLALAVIFVPVIFDRERIEPVDKRTQIPPAPHIESIEIEKALKPVSQEKAVSAKEMYIPDDQQAVDIQPEAPSVDNNGVPKSWIIQIASFRFEKRAEKLRDQLVKDGYAAFTRDIEKDGSKMTRLYVGPKLDKNILIRQKKEIEKKHKVSPILLRFEP